MGPCFPYEEDILSGYSRIVSVIGKVVPDEVTPTLEQVQGWWEKALCRFEELRRVLLLEEKQRQVRREST